MTDINIIASFDENTAIYQFYKDGEAHVFWKLLGCVKYISSPTSSAMTLYVNNTVVETGQVLTTRLLHKYTLQNAVFVGAIFKINNKKTIHVTELSLDEITQSQIFRTIIPTEENTLTYLYQAVYMQPLIPTYTRDEVRACAECFYDGFVHYSMRSDGEYLFSIPDIGQTAIRLFSTQKINKYMVTSNEIVLYNKYLKNNCYVVKTGDAPLMVQYYKLVNHSKLIQIEDFTILRFLM